MAHVVRLVRMNETRTPLCVAYLVTRTSALTLILGLLLYVKCQMSRVNNLEIHVLCLCILYEQERKGSVVRH